MIRILHRNDNEMVIGAPRVKQELCSAASQGVTQKSSGIPLSPSSPRSLDDEAQIGNAHAEQHGQENDPEDEPQPPEVAPVDVAGGLPTRAGLFRPGVVRDVGVESLLQCPCGDLQNGVTEMYFGGFEVQLVHARAVYECLDFLDGGGSDLGLDLRLEPPFLGASCEAASGLLSSRSATCSQRFQ